MDAKALAAAIATVPDQEVVYQADLAALAPLDNPVTPIGPLSEPPTVDDQALDGLAWYVFNTLRGAADDVEGSSWQDVRDALAAGRQ